jgi:hypothetical protein
VPPAVVCYPGTSFNAQACDVVNVGLRNQEYISSTSIGLSFPTDSCPPVNVTAGEAAGTCSIGDQPRYTVNATDVAHVAKGILFAKKHGIRLVVRNTGHDLLGRSTGYGSLQIWVKYIRQGVSFQRDYRPTDGCVKQGWRGSAIKIGGGYIWSEVYDLAASNNVVVVGGGTPSVGCLGGWMQGGGHGPAAHDFGLGADQVLEARVVLANGDVVTANPCQNPDLFFAIRGGGPSTYGVVVSTIVKAHPTKKVAAQQLSFSPLTANDVPAFMDAVALIYKYYPTLSDAGYSGYGSWELASPFPPYTAGYRHAIAALDKTSAEVEEYFQPIKDQIKEYQSRLKIDVVYSAYPTFVAYYTALSGIASPVGQTAALGSRLLDRDALTADPVALKETLSTIVGPPEQFTSINVIFTTGGQVFRDASDPYSGVNPAWRRAYVHNIVARGWAPGTSEAAQEVIRDDVTFTKVKAMKDLAPDMGAYMNEAAVNDPDYLQDFYGQNLVRLQTIKRKYDPEKVFYCPTCVGSNEWISTGSGKLCHA